MHALELGAQDRIGERCRLAYEEDVLAAMDLQRVDARTVRDLLVAAVRAAVVAPEREVPRWFSWRWLIPDRSVERLVAEGRLERPEAGWVTTP